MTALLFASSHEGLERCDQLLDQHDQKFNCKN
jgi:hypothetical protein